MSNVTVYGVHLSPYVRKVRLALKCKGVEFDTNPVMPIPAAEKPQEFLDNSPLGKIPLLRVGDNYVPDSAIICDFIEREFTTVALIPSDPLMASKALWFQHYADTQMVPVISGHLFVEQVLAKNVFGREPVQEEIDAALKTEIPALFDYLTEQLQGDYLVGNSLTLADIAVGGQFITLAHCGYDVDAARWPEVSAYAQRLMSLGVFLETLKEEQQLLSSMA